MAVSTHKESLRRGDLSSIKVDNNHHLVITGKPVPDHPLWYVCQFCLANSEHLIPVMFDSLVSARKHAYELSKTKCDFCYDENGLMRK